MARPMVPTPPEPTLLSLLYRRGRMGVVLALAIIVGVVLVTRVHDHTRAQALADAQSIGQQRLGLYAATMRSALDHFSYLPATIALDREVIDLLTDPAPGEAEAINRKLETINDKAGSASLYLMNSQGMTVAASNWQTETSYLGKDYSFRPYFAEAVTGGTGRFFGIGVTTLLPGYFLASPVHGRDGAIIGVVVVKIDLETLESDWGQSDDAVMVTDEDGVIILTSHRPWKYAIDGPITPTLRHKLDKTRRYGAIDIRPLARETVLPLAQGARMEQTDERLYVAQSERLPTEGWTIHYLVDWEAMELRIQTVSALVGVGWAAMILLGLYLRQRRVAFKAGMDAREAVAEALRRARDDLEQTVAQRTAALSSEITERQRTERDLRATQDELIHAGKMAALGQMSAAIAHELNQPLAAIQTFLASSRVLLERGAIATVEQNLLMIEDLGKRMADIIRHLRVFARKSPTAAQPLDPAIAIGRALLLLEPRLRQAAITVAAPSPLGLLVSGDPGRLEQVFVNLFANAIDAMAEADPRYLTIAIAREEDCLLITVEDSGPGLPAEALNRVFEPFFTTKEVGDGLGLGLSLSYGIIRDMAGAIRAENDETGGACFTITLPLYQPSLNRPALGDSGLGQGPFQPQTKA